MSRNGYILEARGVYKSFFTGGVELKILRGADLKVSEGEILAILGASGVGKSTLLHILGLLDPPDSGEILLEGKSLYKLDRRSQAHARNMKMGFVFQFYHLLPDLDTLENTVLPVMAAKSLMSWSVERHEAREKAKHYLDLVGLGERLHHRPAQLSGGERQRVAIARALVNEPKILFCDEPTGNLDAGTSREVQALLWGLKEELGSTLVIVTHDEQFARAADRTVRMAEGKIFRM
jgi:lipoprotein-releasing system ATP-binding protein